MQAVWPGSSSTTIPAYMFSDLWEGPVRRQYGALLSGCRFRACVVQQTLGHASPATTSRYAHARPRQSAGAYLAGVFGPLASCCSNVVVWVVDMLQWYGEALDRVDGLQERSGMGPDTPVPPSRPWPGVC